MGNLHSNTRGQIALEHILLVAVVCGVTGGVAGLGDAVYERFTGEPPAAPGDDDFEVGDGDDIAPPGSDTSGLDGEGDGSGTDLDDVRDHDFPEGGPSVLTDPYAGLNGESIDPHIFGEYPAGPGDGLPGDGLPGDGLPGDGSPGDGSPGDGSPGDGLPGDGSPGDGSGDTGETDGSEGGLGDPSAGDGDPLGDGGDMDPGAGVESDPGADGDGTDGVLIDDGGEVGDLDGGDLIDDGGEVGDLSGGGPGGGPVVDAAPGVDVDRSDDGREDLDTRPRGGDGTSGGGGGSTGSGPAASVTPTATVDVDVDADEEECGLGCQMRELVRASRDLVVAAADLGRIQREQQARQGVVDFLSRVLGWFGFDGLAESVEKWNQNQLRDQMREIRRLQREVRSLTREIAASHAENLIVPAPDEVVVDTVIGPGWVEALPAAGQEWVDEITAAAEEYDLDPRLLAALVWQESSFKPNAESNANGGNGEGAYGLAQLMPATAEGLGVDRYDPMENLLGGARYLREQLDRFGSNELALAAYNAGPGNVQEYGGIPPFEETQAYVPRVLGFYETLMQADANHGAAPEPEPRVVAAGEFPNDGKASDAAPILAFPIDMSTRDTNPNDHKAVTFGDDYHYRKPSGRLHEGVDIFAARGTPVLATADGVVARTGHNPDMSGYYIVITHDNGYETKYMHLNNDNPGTDDGQGGEAAAFAPGLGAGTRVEAGQVIGYVGDSGNAEGTQPHVHFELLKNGEHTSPYPGLQSSWGDRGGSPGIDW